MRTVSVTVVMEVQENNCMQEIWKDIDGYIGYYQVSNLGRVKSLDRVTSDGKFRKGKILKQTICASGYYVVELCKNNCEKQYRVNILVAQTFVTNDDPINKTQVGHKDETKTNNHADNLEWVTPRENCNMPLRKQRISNSLTGKQLSDEHKSNLSKSHIGYQPKAETKDKCREAMRDRFIPVICDGIIFECMEDCAKHYNINSCTLSLYLSGKYPMPKKWIDKGLQKIDRTLLTE